MSSVTNRLVFDPTGPASGSNMGAYIRAGSDGDLIASQTIAAEEWLNVASALHAGDGTAITETAGALDVNIASGSLSLAFTYDYAEDSAHTTGDVGAFILGVRQDSLASSVSADGDYGAIKFNAKGEVYVKDTDVLAELAGGISVDDGGGSLTVDGTVAATQSGTWDIGTLTSITNDVSIDDGGNSITVDAVQLDIDDLNATDDAVQAWCFDGTGNAIGSTTGSLDVNVTNSIDLDDDLADTAIQNTTTAVSTTAVNCVTSALAARKWLALANEGNKSLYFGKTGVTIVNGFPLHPGMQQVWRVGPSVAPQIIGETGSSSEDLRVMELS